MFHQMEGLAVDEGLTLAHLKGTMLHFFRELLGKDREILLQPHFFPFTEPSVDIQVSYIDKNGRSSWLELAGAGMVDPNVLEYCGIDSRALHRLRVRLRPRPHRDDPLRRPRPAPLLRERPALPGAVRVRVPLSWLAEHADAGLPAEELARRLSGSGTLVEAIHHLGVPDTNGNLAVVPGRAACCRPSSTRTPTGCASARSTWARARAAPASSAARPTSPPARPSRWRSPAPLLPGADKPLGVAKLRGVESRGMILSARELGLGDDHSGIMVLPEGPAPGTPLAEVLPLAETILELEITSNRPDCLAVYGVAREVHAVTGAALRPLDESDPPADGRRATCATTRPSRCTRPTSARATWPACSST